jgi:hypothetical protein
LPGGSEIPQTFRPTAEQTRRRRNRSVAIALMLGALVVLFFIVTVVRLGPGILDRPL